MRTSNWILLAAVAAIGASFASCNCPGPAATEDGGTGGGSGGGDDGGVLPDSGTCIAAGQPCDVSKPCCAGACSNGLCTSSTFCKGAGGTCAINTDCCLNNCNGSTCGQSA